MGLRDTLLRLAMEEADGKTRDEREFTYYGRVNPETIQDELAKAKSSERQEQWKVQVDIDHQVAEGLVQEYAGEVRIRKSERSDGETTYTLCIKSWRPHGDSAKREAEVEVSADMFELLSQFATAGMRKTRYHFPREDGLVWEVDIYDQREGSDQLRWCKIDLEVPSDREPPTDFPITISDVVNGDYRKRTDEERALVKRLMDEAFVLPNPNTIARKSPDA